MRTGTRWTILVKLPVAFSGGSRLNTEPEAGETLSTVPTMSVSGKASTSMCTFWPGFREASCVSLKLASTCTLVSGTSAARRAPGCT